MQGPLDYKLYRNLTHKATISTIDKIIGPKGSSHLPSNRDAIFSPLLKYVHSAYAINSSATTNIDIAKVADFAFFSLNASTPIEIVERITAISSHFIKVLSFAKNNFGSSFCFVT